MSISELRFGFTSLLMKILFPVFNHHISQPVSEVSIVVCSMEYISSLAQSLHPTHEQSFPTSPYCLDDPYKVTTIILIRIQERKIYSKLYKVRDKDR